MTTSTNGTVVVPDIDRANRRLAELGFHPLPPRKKPLRTVWAAVSGATRPLIDDRQFSQQEARAITRIMALQNWMPLASLYSTMIADLPAYKLRREESWRILDRAGLTER